MCRKIFLLILWGLSPFLVLGSAPTPVLTLSSSFSVNTVACDLPAPTNFQVTAIGTTWVTLSWVPTVGVTHHIKVFRSSDGALIDQAFIGPSVAQTVTFNTLVSGETYYATACAVCPDGTDSNYKATTPDFDAIGIELIVSGYTPPEGGTNCTINAVGEYCVLPSDGSTAHFRIQRSNGSLAHPFNVYAVSNPKLKFKVTGHPVPANMPYIFWIDSHEGDDDWQGGNTIHIKFGETTKASFEMYVQNSERRLIWTGGDGENFQIVRVAGTGLSKPPKGISGERDDSSSELQPLLAFAAPNPFSEILDVYLEQNTAENVTLQLFNLSGQKVLDQQFAGGQEQYSLPTADLSPGFYMLRIEADGEVHTLKVIKSE
ncbi:MAG: T9SS type A sorting domain-containing protein [Lewinellaceae bacterium]|nr:T9SS type A sorting domain-containing protein [Lewinellaceae bacterium]